MKHHTLPCYTIINENMDPAPMEGETFLPVPGYPDYEVSDYGRVRSHKGHGPRILKGTANNRGYIQTALRRDGKRKTRHYHVLVAQAHLGQAPAGKPNVLHANDVKADNRISNLRYGSQADNARDRIANGNDQHARKTHCPRGHAYVAANTYVATDGRRACASCQRAHAAAQTAKKAGRPFDFHADADRRYAEIISAPDADLTPVLSRNAVAA